MGYRGDSWVCLRSSPRLILAGLWSIHINEQKQLMLINSILSVSSNEGQNSKWRLLKWPFFVSKMRRHYTLHFWKPWHQARNVTASGSFQVGVQNPYFPPTSYDISTKRKWGGISFAGERETILNAISLDIWTAAGLIKGFQQLLGFLAQFLLFFCFVGRM